MTYVYMIKDGSNHLYIGVSDNPNKRLLDHNRRAGATYTKSGTFHIVFLEKHHSLKETRAREFQIKKWRREKKDNLIKRYMNGLPTKIQ